MTRAEAIQQAKEIAGSKKPLFVILDKELNDFFISEVNNFSNTNDFYETSPYEIIEIFN